MAVGGAYWAGCPRRCPHLRAHSAPPVCTARHARENPLAAATPRQPWATATPTCTWRRPAVACMRTCCQAGGALHLHAAVLQGARLLRPRACARAGQPPGPPCYAHLRTPRRCTGGPCTRQRAGTAAPAHGPPAAKSPSRSACLHEHTKPPTAADTPLVADASCSAAPASQPAPV